MKIIAFVGMPGAGKSEASKVAKKMNIPVINMGDIVREETAKQGLPPTDKNIGGTGDRLRKEEGMDAIAKRCIPKINELRSKVVVIDGTRNKEEVEYFKKKFGANFRLIAIHAPFEQRFERVKHRLRSDDRMNKEEFKKREEREKSWGLETLIRMADITIENTSSLEKFHKAVEEVLRYEC